MKSLIGDKLPMADKKIIYGSFVCDVCGESITESVQVLGDTFTDRERLKNGHICRECSRLFSDEFRKTAIYCTEKELKKLKQSDFENLLFEGQIEFPCLISFSESRKKHRLFRTRVSLSRLNVFVSTDSGEVEFDLEEDAETFSVISDFYNKYTVSKGWIETGEYPTQTYITIGYDVIKDFENKISSYRGTRKFILMIAFLNKKEKNGN
jgi:hypothetical protein